MRNAFILINLIFVSLSYAMEPYLGRVNMSEEHYTAMQGIIHFIGWSLAIGILIWVFKFMKKHAQQDERYKKYVEQNKEKQQDLQQGEIVAKENKER